MSAQLTSSVFQEFVHTEFQVWDDPSNVFPLTLGEVVEQAKTERQEIFSLFFHGPKDFFMPQGIRKLKHNQLGELDLFLVPIARDQDGFQYEAVFNNPSH